MDIVHDDARSVQLDMANTFAAEGFDALLSDGPFHDEAPELDDSHYFEPSEEDRAEWAAMSAAAEALDGFDEWRNLEDLAALSAALERLERGLLGDGCDHCGSFVGHPA
jgi:hypothetical protein